MARILVDERYEIRGLAGSGGMAEVFLAHDNILDRDVALKMLKDKFTENDEFVERFKREAQSAAALSHPNIVPIFDRGASEDGTYYIAMEYLSGGTLKDRILSKGALPARRSEEHTSELQSRQYLVCRLLLEKKKEERREQVRD